MKKILFIITIFLNSFLWADNTAQDIVINKNYDFKDIKKVSGTEFNIEPGAFLNRKSNSDLMTLVSEKLIKKVYLDLKITVEPSDKETIEKINNIKSTFYKKIRNDFKNQSTAIKLLPRASNSLNYVLAKPNDKQPKSFKDLLSLGVLNVHLVYAKDTGLYFSSVNLVAPELSLHNRTMVSKYWVGTSKSLNTILFNDIYSEILINLKKADSATKKAQKQSPNKNKKMSNTLTFDIRNKGHP
ncbi:MAG: hypothetical protein V3V19_04310 [Cocleimonas sp.]